MNKDYSIQFSELEDIDSWMKMVEIVKSNFPGLETKAQLESYKQTVIKNIKRHTAICVKYFGEVTGIMIFSYNLKCLSCMAVHPNHRRNGIASAMIELMLESFPNDIDIKVSTFIENDIRGVAPRALYKKFGFVEAEFVTEFGQLNQKFILHRLNNRKGD